MSSPTPTADTSSPTTPTIKTPAAKKPPYPFYLGGLAATIAASITHPLDLTKVRLQASGDKRMIESIKKTVRTAGARGLFDGITGTWMRQMSYSLCRFWAYDESKKILGANPQSPPWVLAAAGVMAGSIAGIVGNPGEVVMVRAPPNYHLLLPQLTRIPPVRLQGDLAKPPEKRFNYKHCFDALFRVGLVSAYRFVGSGGLSFLVVLLFSFSLFVATAVVFFIYFCVPRACARNDRHGCYFSQVNDHDSGVERAYSLQDGHACSSIDASTDTSSRALPVSPSTVKFWS
ncbi:mitochondrial carrier domain-containing protein [Melanogaster broomeanus]|nr:mitochondrial carrier domain-containing protein [Melanogaster broomeanus]